MSFTLYGARGSGSVPVEAALTLLGLPYTVVEAPTWEGDEVRDRVAPVNPMRQVPAVVLPSGEVMTESAAILIWLADRFAPGELAPLPDAPDRAAFLRWMVYVPANIYPMYWVKDEPSRLAQDKAAEDYVVEQAIERIKQCWRVLAEQLHPSPYALGERFTVLDLYLTVVSRWTPRRRWHRDVGSPLVPLFERVDADPRLEGLWADSFPFEEGWEG